MRLLDRPVFFRLIQLLFGPGAEKIMIGKFREILARLPEVDRVLDVGCGPASWLSKLDEHPMGFDLSLPYLREFRRSGLPAVQGTANRLPFRDGVFGGAWSIGLLHHLSDGAARRTVEEMLRVVRPGGYAMVFDAMLPESFWTKPVPWLVRKLDRGRFMRHEQHLRSLVASTGEWTFESFDYTKNGLEGVLCTSLKKRGNAYSEDC